MWVTSRPRPQDDDDVSATVCSSSKQIIFGILVSIREKCPGEGVLPYIGYTGMCRWKGYGFQAI